MVTNAEFNHNQPSSPVNKRRSIEDLKVKYEFPSTVFETPNTMTTRSPKKMRKSKVKQMASMFNSKISHMIKGEVDVGKYTALVNEFSPECKRQSPTATTTVVKPIPMPMPRTRLTKPPIPSPRLNSFAKVQEYFACFVPEDVFAKLSVRDKAQLYTLFVEEMAKKHPNFGQMENRNNHKTKRGEVIEEKQASVKELLEELEFNNVFPKSKTQATKAIQRMDSMKRACAERKKSQAKEFEVISKKKTTAKQQKAKSLPRCQNPAFEASASTSTDDKQSPNTAQSVFDSEQLENMFFSWFKEQSGSANDAQSEIDEEKHKSIINTLLEEAIAKLETLEVTQNNTKPKPMPRKKKSATSAKPSETEESESGLSSLPKTTSEESQPESHAAKTDKSHIGNDIEFAKPLKPLRKKKLRKNQVWKKEVSLREGKQIISTTDSESDNKQAEAKLKKKNLSLETAAQEDTTARAESNTSLADLNQSLLKLVNSPSKIKSAYTLTVNDFQTPLCTPRVSLNFATKQQTQINTAAKKLSLTESLTDQGFETATNDADSPLKRSAMQDQAETINSPLSTTLNFAKGSFGFSTPIKNQEQSAAGTSSAKRLFSPASKTTKSRRKSFYDVDSRRNSLVMQVIREDQPLDPLETSNNIFSQTEQNFFANAPTIENPKDTTELPTDKISEFWIKCGDFSVALEINYIDNGRLRLLYEIFSQTSCDTKDLHFGIDNHKFSVHSPLDTNNISTRIPAAKGSSHYWFSTGDLAIPFNGKFLASHKIQRLFNVIKETVEETGVLRFGVDEVEFSNVPEFWYQTPKFSVDSQYSMLVGLQTGDSNGLEGRSKYAWPHSKPVMISDLDKSDNEADNYEEVESGRLSFSPFGSNHHNLSCLDNEELSMRRNSLAMMSLESFCGEYENEPLDQLFNGKYSRNPQKELQQTQKMSVNDMKYQQELQQTQTMSVPEMINTVEYEKQRLNGVQQQLSNYGKPSYIAKDSLDAYKGTPEYVKNLKNIVSDISNIGCNNNFKACSVEELDSYMYFLSRYAEICLSSCNKHMETVLDALGNHHKAVVPPENELQKSHDHNPAALSEHQLRIQASLQRLNIPDWFRQYNQNQKSPDGTGATSYKPGNFTRKRAQDSGRWVGLNSKTTSLSSLGSQRSDRSPLLLSPSAHSHHGGQSSTQHAGQHGHTVGSGTTASSGAFSRWSTSHLNSSQTSPSVSQRGSFSRGGPINSSFMSVNSGHSVIRNSMRQPYLGWRSQEKLSQRTAHERLASSLLSQQQRTSPTKQTVTANNDKLLPVTPEIQSSIKEVTSAIVHYVNDQTNQQRSRSTSPNSRKCWLESSFVGTRPLDSPQTPIIENTPLITAAQAASSLTILRPPLLNHNLGNNNNNNLQYANRNLDGSLNLSTFTGNDLQLTRMNGGLNNGTGSSSAGGVNLAGVERSLSNASLEDVLASLLGLPTHQTGANASDAYARSSTGGALVSESQTPATQTQPQQQQKQIPHHMPQKPQPLKQFQNPEETKENLLAISKEEQQRLRRRSEGDAATKQKHQQQQQQLQQQEQQQQQFEQKSQHNATNAKTYASDASDTITSITNTNTTANGHAGGATAFLPPRRVSLGDSSESNNRTASASGELQIKCRNNKCDRTATPADAKKYYKSCHNCTYLYCSRECRRAHWEKHRKACLHSRVSNLCRQVLASCKDDSDSLRHLSLLARKGFLSQGRGVVRILFRSPEAAEGFIKNGFQCMGEASYVRWPDLMPAEMGLELYSELLKLSTEYRPDSKMLVYVAVCVVSEAPGMGQAPVRWERQLVSRCAKLKLCKSVLAELEQQQQPLPQPVTVVAVPEPTTEVLILTFNPQLRSSTAQRELVLSNILDILSRRGVILRKHYPEIFQRLQTYTEGQTDKFNPVTLHPRDSHTGQNFVCIIMPVQSETEIIKLPSIADGGNRVTTIDVGSSAALAQLDDDELLTRTTTTVAS